MPRNSGGTYSLPAGNPVVTATLISSTWANTTLADIGTALTGSLDRSGQGAMLAKLQLFDGAIGAPGLTWGTEPTSGIYRNAAGDFRSVIGGVDLWQWSSTIFQANIRFNLANTDPEFDIIETDGAANNKTWYFLAQSEQLKFGVVNDARSTFTNYMLIDRTGTTVDSIAMISTTKTWNSGGRVLNWGVGTAFAANQLEMYTTGAQNLGIGTAGAGALNFYTNSALIAAISSAGVFTYGGLEIGLKNYNIVGASTSTTITSAFNQALILFFGGVGQTFSFDPTTWTDGSWCTVYNSGSALAIAASGGGTIVWFNGAAAPTGSRTLSTGGAMTAVKNGTSIWITGTGIS